MEPIPYYFDTINRTALIIKCKKPFFDWLTSIDADNKNIKMDIDSDVYLLPDFEDVSEMKKWLKKGFDNIFSDQLNNWYTDENLWPENRTFKQFKEWFDYTLHTMIFDTQDGPIRKFVT
jgi:hypothetical protein